MTVGTIDNNGRRQLSSGIAGVNIGDVVIETGDVSQFGRHILTNEGGEVNVVVSADGINFAAGIAFEDLRSTTPATRVTATVAAGMYLLLGNFKNIKVAQNGATAATSAFLLSV